MHFRNPLCADEEHRALLMCVQETARLSREIRGLEHEAVEPAQSLVPLALRFPREDPAAVSGVTAEQPEGLCAGPAHTRARMAAEALSVLVRRARSA